MDQSLKLLPPHLHTSIAHLKLLASSQGAAPPLLKEGDKKSLVLKAYVPGRPVDVVDLPNSDVVGAVGVVVGSV